MNRLASLPLAVFALATLAHRSKIGLTAGCGADPSHGLEQLELFRHQSR